MTFLAFSLFCVLLWFTLTWYCRYQMSDSSWNWIRENLLWELCRPFFLSVFIVHALKSPPGPMHITISLHTQWSYVLQCTQEKWFVLRDWKEKENGKLFFLELRELWRYHFEVPKGGLKRKSWHVAEAFATEFHIYSCEWALCFPSVIFDANSNMICAIISSGCLK